VAEIRFGGETEAGIARLTAGAPPPLRSVGALTATPISAAPAKARAFPEDMAAF
jgi:hypothetical protein